MKALVFSALALLALALPSASEAQVYARGGNGNFQRGGFARQRGNFAVVQGRVRAPQILVVKPARPVGFFGRFRAGVRAFRGGR